MRSHRTGIVRGVSENNLTDMFSFRLQMRRRKREDGHPFRQLAQPRRETLRVAAQVAGKGGTVKVEPI